MKEEVVFTPSAILHLLTEIDELKDKDVGLTELPDGNLQISIGESIYNIETNNTPTEVEVDEEVIEIVDQENQDTIEQLADNGEFELSEQETIESGVLSGIVKSLLLGGMIRLAPKLLK